MALKNDNKVVSRGTNPATFADMMSNGFGIVTVMNAKVYEVDDTILKDENNKPATPKDIIEAYKLKTKENGLLFSMLYE